LNWQQHRHDTIAGEVERAMMAEFSDKIRERKLYEKKGDYTSQVTITIETADPEYHVRIKYGMNQHNFGLRDPEKPNAPTPMYTVKLPKVLPFKTFQQAVWQAEIEFRTLIDQEFFTPLPAGEDFPS
jgi:hypothetical protein